MCVIILLHNLFSVEDCQLPHLQCFFVVCLFLTILPFLSVHFSNTEYNLIVIQPSPRSISRTFSSFLTDTPYPLNNNFPAPAPQPLAMTILLSVSVNLTMFSCFNLSNQGIEWMILSGLTIIPFRVSVSCVWKQWAFVYALVTPDLCPGTCWWGGDSVTSKSHSLVPWSPPWSFTHPWLQVCPSNLN